ncbi:MAG: hypothetical protein E7010_00450 [Alphaproteobacteria bacterium]|nr:hypothetical protein [Alphaproteobacteria bacterium]
MRTTFKHATKANLCFFAFTWFIALWALVKIIILWPEVYWNNLSKIVVTLAASASILFITAFLQSRLKHSDRRRRIYWIIVAKQQYSMAIFLLLEVTVILFITLIYKALCL